MAIVCGNDQVTGPFARKGAQSSRSLGARMDQPPTSPVIDLDNQPQGFDDFDDFEPSETPNDTPTTATYMAKKISSRGSSMLEPERVAIIDQLMEALHACRQPGITHRDFNSVECFGERWAMRGVVGTPYYFALEMVAGREYKEMVDVWSSGVILCLMLGGIPLFYGETTMDIFKAVLRGNLRF
ncbi:phosphoenolpyruvate carboxylase kinase 1-like [Dioscorea cayenensis subsp. rotundata]|uniref:Phosphoenolpyruvate carboxylase kinase 1-like n=1 Tax=Dioscorea cayennensis subsp. rotundata TaxID=55577 RepID=A0AB40C2Y1_DIOCR|nr:phosphoenolpyruvate carboxylase kinase 1-like [Dioscorea cayenensis subsp. rotundata]